MPASAAAFDTFDAVFTDRSAEFQQRMTWSMWREDADQGAPPFGVDLDNGPAVLPRSAPDREHDVVDFDPRPSIG
jgi:hypothetical protein